MYKTKQIINHVKDFKKSFNIDNKDGYFIKYGSFYRYDKKYINDIDINLLVKSKKLSSRKELIMDIIKQLEANKEIVYKKYYIGHHPYFYRKKHTISYFKKLHKSKYINQKQLKKLEKDMNKNTIADILELCWSYSEIKKEEKVIQNKKVKLSKCLEKDELIWFDLILKYKGNLLPIEMVIITENSFKKKTPDKDNIYMGCKLPIKEYELGNYYNFCKRLQACYFVNIKRGYYKNLSEKDSNYLYKTAHYVKKYLQKKEKDISEYHQKQTKCKLKNKESDKLLQEFNKTFKSISEKLYKTGVEHNLLY